MSLRPAMIRRRQRGTMIRVFPAVVAGQSRQRMGLIRFAICWHRHISVVGAVMSNAMYSRGVEDSGVGVLRTDDGITGIVESGYTYPAGTRSGDHFFRFVGTKASVLSSTAAMASL